MRSLPHSIYIMGSGRYNMIIIGAGNSNFLLVLVLVIIFLTGFEVSQEQLRHNASLTRTRTQISWFYKRMTILEKSSVKVRK